MTQLLDWRELYEVDPVAFAAACIEDERRTVPGPRVITRWPDGWCAADEDGVTSIYYPADERWENSVTDEELYLMWMSDLIDAHPDARDHVRGFTGNT